MCELYGTKTLNEAATLRMYARQLRLFRKEVDIKEVHSILESMRGSLPDQYIDMFKHVSDLDATMRVADAAVNHVWEMRGSR